MAELREEKWDRVLAALLSGAGTTRGDALRASKSATWKVPHSPGTTIGLDSDRRRIGQRLAMGHPTRV